MNLFNRFVKVIASLFSATSGAAMWGKDTLEDSYNYFTGDKKIKFLLHKIHLNNKKFQFTYKNYINKYPYLDSAVISGLFLPQMTGWFRSAETKELAQEVYKAYEYAYPLKAKEQTFTEAWSSFSNEESLNGFVSGIKGKLFEIKYAKYLNENLDEGYTATLAKSPTQEYWDIRIDGPDQNYTEYLQLKATNNVEYIKETIKQNSQIDIVTLEDLQGQLLLTSGSIEYSDISHEDLLNQIESIDGYNVDNILPPMLGLGWIVFDEFKKDNGFLYKSYKTGKRSANYFANGSIIAVTGMGGIPIIFLKEGLLNKGNEKKQKIKQLKNQLRYQTASMNRVYKKVFTRRQFLKTLAAGSLLAMSPKKRFI